MYSSGLRVAEVVLLNIGDMDFSLRYLFVKGKGRKERVVPFGSYADVALKLYLDEVRPVLTKNVSPSKDAPLFVNWKGQRLSTRGLYGIVSKYLKLLDPTRNFTPHSLRHTFATHLLEGEQILDLFRNC